MECCRVLLDCIHCECDIVMASDLLRQAESWLHLSRIQTHSNLHLGSTFCNISATCNRTLARMAFKEKNVYVERESIKLDSTAERCKE